MSSVRSGAPRVVLDTNVLISGTLWPGVCATILDRLETGSYRLVVSPWILQEYREVLHSEEIIRKRAAGQLTTHPAIKAILRHALLVKPRRVDHIIREDRDDDHVLAAAYAARARFIVTQDKHILRIAHHRGTKIVTPLKFLQEH